MADNKTVGRVVTMYVPGTTSRIKQASEEVAEVLRKPRGAVTKQELEQELDKVERMRSAQPPLSSTEEMNRLSMHMSLTQRAASEGLMTSDEIMGRRDTMAIAIGGMAMSGGGVGRAGPPGGAATGPMLPRTSSPPIKVPPRVPPAGAKSPGPTDGIFVQKPPVTRVGRWMSAKEYNAMKKSGKPQEGSGGATYGATSGSDSFYKQAKPGDVYVEYDVQASSVLPGSKPDWVMTIGPNANNMQKAALLKQGGELLPSATNISDILRTK